MIYIVIWLAFLLGMAANGWAHKEERRRNTIRLLELANRLADSNIRLLTVIAANQPEQSPADAAAGALAGGQQNPGAKGTTQ